MSYQAYVTKLGKANRSLFADGKPTFARMKQGPAGDCYLFSGAGWWAYTLPQRIVEMIQPLPDDHYLVLFPDGEQVIVTAPTDTELACNESVTTAADGIWMAVLEKAVGTLDYYRDAKTRAVADPSLRVNLGGSPRADVRRWTGNAVDSYRLRDPNQQSAVRDALVAMASRRLMAQAVVLKSDGPAPIPDRSRLCRPRLRPQGRRPHPLEPLGRRLQSPRPRRPRERLAAQARRLPGPAGRVRPGLLDAGRRASVRRHFFW